MFSKAQLAKKYLHYWLTAKNGKGHGIHSPFVFDFVTKVLNDKRTYYCYEPIEQLRCKLKQDNSILTIEDFGAGSRVDSKTERSVSSIANRALKPKKFSQLLFRIVNYFGAKTIVELGTSLGITSAYLACPNAHAHVITMEGAPAVAAVARKNFGQLNIQNIQLIEGNFDNTLPSVIKQLSSKVDLAFIDGNHRKEPTIQYFNQLLNVAHENSILIFDDIHWSKEMEQAWHVIQKDPSVTLTIDLFFIGLVFFRKENKVKQHFSIRF